MNANPKSKRILCYGDSNTWGDPPGKSTRYASNVRWPGKLQELLDDDFEIIEEGLSGRTTDIDDPKDEGRNGKTYLIPCLESHKPIDIFILMLGTNDLKDRFKKSPTEIAESVGDLIRIVKKAKAGPRGKAPEAILISPTHLQIGISSVSFGIKDATEKSKELGKHLERVARENKCEFIDISKSINPSPIDGAHLSADSHKKMAGIVSKKVKLII